MNTEGGNEGINVESLISDFDNCSYFVQNSDVSIRAQHWAIYLELVGLSDFRRILEKLSEIESDVMQDKNIKGIIAQAFYLNGDYPLAKEYLEEIWNENPKDLTILLDIYRREDEWDKIKKCLDLNEKFDSDGVIICYEVESLLREKNNSEAEEILLEKCTNYISSPWFINKVLRLASEYSMETVVDTYIELLLVTEREYSKEDRITIACTLFDIMNFDELREFLNSFSELYEEEIELYFLSFGEIPEGIIDFDSFRDEVYRFYIQGVRYRYIFNCKLHVEMKTKRISDAIRTLYEYKSIYGDDLFYALNIVQCVELGALEINVEKEVQALLETEEIAYYFVVAKFYAYRGRWESAKSTAIKAVYEFCDKVGYDECLSFVNLFTDNRYLDTHLRQLYRANVDSVILLENITGEKEQLCIHSDDSIVSVDGEEKYGCLNYKGSSGVSIILKATAFRERTVSYRGEQWEVKDIVDTFSYYLNYFLAQLTTEYKTESQAFTIPVNSDDPTEAQNELQQYLIEMNEPVNDVLDSYNFKHPVGAPISAVSGLGRDKYVETIFGLLNQNGQRYYSAYNDVYNDNSKYVLSISSLIMLNKLGYLEHIKSIASKLIITEGAKLFIRKGLDESIRSEGVYGIGFLNKSNKLETIISTEDSRFAKNKFWSELFMLVNDHLRTLTNSVSSKMFDEMNSFVDISEFESIEICESESAIFVCDDLFISKLGQSLNNLKSINSIGLLYYENLIDVEELVELILSLLSQNYINCIDHNMLFDIYSELLSHNKKKDYDEKYSNVKYIFNEILNPKSINCNSEVYRLFLEKVKQEGKLTLMLYNLIREPLGLESLEDIENRVKKEFFQTYFSR